MLKCLKPLVDNKLVIVLIVIVVILLYFLRHDIFILFESIFPKIETMATIGELLAFSGTVLLGALALWQSNKAAKVNNDIQLHQIQLQKQEQHDKELQEVKQNVQKVLLSFDIHIFDYLFDKITDIDIEYLISELHAARKNAYNSGVYLELIKHFNNYTEKCLDCEKSCKKIDKTKSRQFIECVLNFKKNYYETYTKKYLESVDKCLYILYKRAESDKTDKTIVMLLSEARQLNNDGADRYHKNEATNLNIFNNYTQLSQTMPDLAQRISENLAEQQKSYEQNHKLVSSKLDLIEKLEKSPRYTNADMMNELKSIAKDISDVRVTLYNHFKTMAYGFIAQYESEI